MEPVAVIVVALWTIGMIGAFASKVHVAAPLLLVAVGIAVGYLPFMPEIHLDSEWILAGILPPLLYSASVSMPTMNFRREFGAISGLSVVLVVVSSVLMGLLFWRLIPGIDLTWGIALGAIVSPTDAVATGIVKSAKVSPRIISILDGESQLNDATALVLLRTAIAAAAISVSAWSVIGDFIFSVVAAIVIGLVVGRVDLFIRSHISNRTVNTALSFTVPFIASLPAEALGASGLVAAVAAGLVTGIGAARHLSALQRESDTQNWKTAEFLLEGIIFLLMGLEMRTLVDDLGTGDGAFRFAVAMAAISLVVVLLIRGVFLVPLLVWLRRSSAQKQRSRAKLEQLRPGDPSHYHQSTPTNTAGRRNRRRWSRVRSSLADLDYLQAMPLTWRDGIVLVWAGMRGAVTVAAAQSLPEDTPNRALLVLIAFFVAGGSLLLQGGTLRWVIAWVKPTPPPSDSEIAAQRDQLKTLLRGAARHAGVAKGAGPTEKLTVLRAQRRALLRARDEGLYDADLLSDALQVLDARTITLELIAQASEPESVDD